MEMDLCDVETDPTSERSRNWCFKHQLPSNHQDKNGYTAICLSRAIRNGCSCCPDGAEHGKHQHLIQSCDMIDSYGNVIGRSLFVKHENRSVLLNTEFKGAKINGN